MERGIYFDGWYRDEYCYHPTLPFRSLRMIEDLSAYRGTLLVWSALGGGSLSLPFLEHEAYGDVDPRLRYFGFMNDAEYIEECRKRGIKVFGIVFEAQGWEVPAVYDRGGFRLLNVMPASGTDESGSHEWYGLREFSRDEHADVFGRRFRDYFPDGLTDIHGRPVSDLWEECCTRDLQGRPCHTGWVEMEGHRHECRLMCRNNPVWRRYLKKIIEIQIDAGVAGIQLDEPESPIPAIDYGGCFCESCMTQFREYLAELSDLGKPPGELAGMDLRRFHYGEFLKRRGAAYPGDPASVPLFRQYWDFLLTCFKRFFGELADHARAYAESRGRDILVSGNFFNLLPPCFPNEPAVDVIITEMKQTLFRQPYWYRYAAGFAGSKPLIVVENPYGGIVPRLVRKLGDGRGFDLYRIFLLEAAMHGLNMAVPYGSWMGNRIRDSFHPPRRATEEVQDFLSSHEELYSTSSGANVVLLYSFPSCYWREVTNAYDQHRLVWEDEEDLLSYRVADMLDPEGPRLPFWEIARRLSDLRVMYDVRFLADGELRADDFSRQTLGGYDLAVLPGCDVLTGRQADALESFADDGGRILFFGQAGANREGWFSRLLEKPYTGCCPSGDSKTEALADFDETFSRMYDGLWQVRVDHPSVDPQIHRLEDGSAVHLLNYAYDRKRDRGEPVGELTLAVRRSLLPGPEVSVRIETLGRDALRYELDSADDAVTIRLFDLPLYTVVLLSGAHPTL